ncbi:MAG TPA: hypothetical protein VGL61_25760 [Kofleriaceae bacterium]
MTQPKAGDLAVTAAGQRLQRVLYAATLKDARVRDQLDHLVDLVCREHAPLWILVDFLGKVTALQETWRLIDQLVNDHVGEHRRAHAEDVADGLWREILVFAQFADHVADVSRPALGRR